MSARLLMSLVGQFTTHGALDRNLHVSHLLASTASRFLSRWTNCSRSVFFTTAVFHSRTVHRSSAATRLSQAKIAIIVTPFTQRIDVHHATECAHYSDAHSANGMAKNAARVNSIGGGSAVEAHRPSQIPSAMRACSRVRATWDQPHTTCRPTAAPFRSIAARTTERALAALAAA